MNAILPHLLDLILFIATPIAEAAPPSTIKLVYDWKEIETMAHILIVDDELMMRFLIRHVLESAGHSISEAQDGRVAFDMLEMYPHLVDMIVLDLQMPHMGGLEFLSTLHDEIAYPPILVLTAHRGPIQAAVAHKVSGHLTKPFRTRALIDLVNSGLNLPRTHPLS